MKFKTLNKNQPPLPENTLLEGRFYDLLIKATSYIDPEIVSADTSDAIITKEIGNQLPPLKLGRQTLDLFIYDPDSQHYYPSLTATWKSPKPQPATGRSINHQDYFSLSMLDPEHSKYSADAAEKLEQLEKSVAAYGRRRRIKKLSRVVMNAFNG